MLSLTELAPPGPAASAAEVRSAQPIIELSHVGVTFETKRGGPVVAVDDFNLTIFREEIVSLVGPSGCGKSTVLRILAGLLQPTSGDIWIGGDQRRRGFSEVAIVFQRPTLLPWLSILRNVLYPVRVLHGRARPQDRARALELLEMVGLADMAERMPHELSGGMQQRAAIARSLILDPKILLMDEPFGALDALTREDLQLDLLDIHARTKKTILLVTHSISEAILLSDRVAVMSARPGRLQDLIEIEVPKPRSQDSAALPSFIEHAKRIRDDIFGPRAPRRTDPWTATHRRILLPIVTFVLFLALWQAISWGFNVPVYLMPSPVEIVKGGMRLGSTLFSNTAETLTTILIGFALSCLVGIPLGVLVSVNRLTSEAIYPLIVFLNAIPIVAIAPVLVVIFGTDATTRLIIVTLISFFPIMVATASGILDTPSEMLDLARVAGASPLTEILTVRLPHAVAFIFGGLRIGVTVAVVGAVVAEFVNANKGLGFLVTSSTAQLPFRRPWPAW